MNRVRISTGSRLHFGLLCGPPGSDWHYGGVGLMIDRPSWELELAKTSEPNDIVVADGALGERIQQVVDRFRSARAEDLRIRCEIIDRLPFHHGLGAGTQLTLALAAGLSVLSGEGRPRDISTVAGSLGRSRRSAVGTFGFDYGGFIVDHGLAAEEKRHCQRFDFPDDWRLVLVTPVASEGLSGCKEESFFDSTGFLDESVLAEFSSLIHDELCPSILSCDFAKFSAAIYNYGRLVGTYYSQGQGGVYSTAVAHELAESLRAQHQPLPVQSSWGPTVAVPAETETAAAELTEKIRKTLGSETVKVVTARARNIGATVCSPAPEDQRTLG